MAHQPNHNTEMQNDKMELDCSDDLSISSVPREVLKDMKECQRKLEKWERLVRCTEKNRRNQEKNGRGENAENRQRSDAMAEAIRKSIAEIGAPIRNHRRIMEAIIADHDREMEYLRLFLQIRRIEREAEMAGHNWFPLPHLAVQAVPQEAPRRPSFNSIAQRINQRRRREGYVCFGCFDANRRRPGHMCRDCKSFIRMVMEYSTV